MHGKPCIHVFFWCFLLFKSKQAHLLALSSSQDQKLDSADASDTVSLPHSKAWISCIAPVKSFRNLPARVGPGIRTLRESKYLGSLKTVSSVPAGSAGVGYRFPLLPLNLHRRMELGVRADAERHQLSSSPISPLQNYLLIWYESEKAFFPQQRGYFVRVAGFNLFSELFAETFKTGREVAGWWEPRLYSLDNHWNRFLALPSASFRSWTNLRVQRLHQCKLCTNCQQKRTNQRQISEQMINGGTITKYIL